MNETNLTVVAGHRREEVGSIPAAAGMLTNEGRIKNVTKSGTVVLEDGRRFTKVAGRLTVRHSEAVEYGYPHASGCNRFRVTNIKRNGEVIAA